MHEACTINATNVLYHKHILHAHIYDNIDINTTIYYYVPLYKYILVVHTYMYNIYYTPDYLSITGFMPEKLDNTSYSFLIDLLGVYNAL